MTKKIEEVSIFFPTTISLQILTNPAYANVTLWDQCVQNDASVNCSLACSLIHLLTTLAHLGGRERGREREREGGREREREGGRERGRERERGRGGEVKKRDIKKSKDTKKDPPFTTFFWSARATFTGNDVMLHYVMSCLVMLLL